MPFQIPTLLKWVFGSIAAGLLWDAIKLSFVSSGFENLLPELAFLVKPIMVVSGVALGGTVLTVGIRDFVTWCIRRREILCEEQQSRNRELRARRQKRRTAEIARAKRVKEKHLKKLDWVINYHDQDTSSPKSYRAQAKSSLPYDAIHQQRKERLVMYVDDLVNAGLIYPELSSTIKVHPESHEMNHLCVVREHLAHRGLDYAIETVKNWKYRNIFYRHQNANPR